MSRRNKAIAASLAAVMAAGCIVPSASAGGYRHRSYNNYSYSNGYYHSGYYHGGYSRAPYAYNGYYDYERDRRRHRRNNIAKGVAIGVGLAILGVALSHGGRRYR